MGVLARAYLLGYFKYKSAKLVIVGKITFGDLVATDFFLKNPLNYFKPSNRTEISERFIIRVSRIRRV